MKAIKKTVTTFPLGYTDYEEVRDEAFGAVGTSARDHYELELRAELLAERFKQLRKRAKLTQTELGMRIGVKKSQISKFEKDATSVSVSTMFKVLHALHATVVVKVEDEQLAALVSA